jgi:uncharacterized protein (TIGR00255 family)
MIQSMTGFGRASFEVAGRSFDVEIRSVNHRHLDARVRVPRPLADHESMAKSLVQARLGRGKVDVTITPSDPGRSDAELQVDAEVAGQYVDAARRLAAEHGLEGTLAVSTLIALPGVMRFVEGGLPPEEVERGVRAGMTAALDAVVAMRSAEGARLAEEIAGRLDGILGLVDFFEQRAGEVVEAARERLRKRTEQIAQETGLYDEARLHQEVVIAADRLDVTEELVRLRSHVDQFREVLGPGSEAGPVGRRLDFLLQELAREANTIGSKANDAPLAHRVVELKTEIERIREQVQNVE